VLGGTQSLHCNSRDEALALPTRRSRRSATRRGTDNLLPPIIAAVEAHATLGEIASALREVFGEHREQSR
jgi:methylmalonyl-CoA mutase N-terminal domain/subunit